MGAMPQSAIPPAVDYPESDGQPMAETDLHRDEMFALIDMLRDHVGRGSASRDYVSGNLFVYYEQGVPSAVFAPDVFLVRGVGGQQRRIYKLWEERVAPEVVLEVSSRKTWLEDHGKKKVLCARLGVAEYWLYDPEADYLHPALQGFRLVNDRYEGIDPAPDGSLESAALGLRLSLAPEDGRIVLVDVRTGRPLQRVEDKTAALRDSMSALRDAEAEIERLRTRLQDQEDG